MSSIAARTETAEQRGAIYDALTKRNRSIGFLRIALPVLAGVMLIALILPIYIGSLVPDFGFAKVTIDRGNLMVETPSYSGIGADGSRYSMRADEARAALGNTDIINLSGVGFDLVQPDGRTFNAIAKDAQLQISSQIVVIDGTTEVGGSSGLTGTVTNAVIDVLREHVVASGGADLVFSGGSTLKADTMSYDGDSKNWTFANVTVELTSLPGAVALEEAEAAEALPAVTP